MNRASTIKNLLCLAGSTCLVLVGGCCLAVLRDQIRHRQPPSPPGIVFRVEAREVVSPMDHIETYAVDRNGPAVAIYAPSTMQHPASLRILRYPGGSSIDEVVGPAAVREREQCVPAVGASDAFFDFNSDGAADAIQVGPQTGEDYGMIRIRSGRDGRVLFEDRDPLEYEDGDRAFSLGDLDGDGYSELALIHPRMDRSKYDLEPLDALFGAKSWITVVSGSRATR